MTTSLALDDEGACPAAQGMSADVGAGLDVLIVEDHFDTAEMLRRYLARRGLAAEVVGSGADALQVLMLSRRLPKCLILDQTMPGMSGLELLRHVRESAEYADIAVYFYSAALERGKQAMALALGAKGWYIKGISRLDDLMRAVIESCSR